MSIFLITAPSGAGKTSIAESIARLGNWHECISVTTRPIRKNETDGKTYYYTNQEKFKEMDRNNEFAECVVYDGHFYGITHNEIKRVMNKGKHIYIIVEYGGYKQVKKLYPEAVGIFIHMSQEDCMANMLLRGDSLEKANKRTKTYHQEIENRAEFDYVIKNVRNKQVAISTLIRQIILCHE